MFPVPSPHKSEVKIPKEFRWLTWDKTIEYWLKYALFAFYEVPPFQIAMDPNGIHPKLQRDELNNWVMVFHTVNNQRPRDIRGPAITSEKPDVAGPCLP